MNDFDGGCGCDGGAAELAGGAVVGGADGLGSKIYTGTAKFGKVYSIFGAVVACIIALIIIVIGVGQVRSPDTLKAEATIAKVLSSTASTQNGSTQYTYLLNAAFTSAAGKAVALTNLSVTTPTHLAAGSKIKVYYSAADPAAAEVSAVSPKALGAGLIVGGFVLAAVGVGIAVAASKSKAFAATVGVLDAAGLVRSVL